MVTPAAIVEEPKKNRSIKVIMEDTVEGSPEIIRTTFEAINTTKDYKEAVQSSIADAIMGLKDYKPKV